MDKHDSLPFEVGQMAESRSFQQGYRGAWFRCKIKEISQRRKGVGHILEYIDFPEEKSTWTKLYQIPPTSRKKGTDVKRLLMVRPQYPSIYHESQMPSASSISEVIVVTSGVWKVGDLVDWCKDCCYWSGKVIQVLGSDKAEIELTPPPMGEGSSYEASFQDLRPSLDWSPEDGWTVPTSEHGGNSNQCARLVYPVNQVGGGCLVLHMPATGEGTRDAQAAYGLSAAPPSPSCVAMKSSAASDMIEPLSLTGVHETNLNLVPDKNSTAEAIFSDSKNGSHIRDGSSESAGQTVGDDLFDSRSPLKKFRTSGGTSLNTLHSNTIEAVILDLEELANKIKWLKGLLKTGDPSSNSARTAWKFQEHRASSIPK